MTNSREKGTEEWRPVRGYEGRYEVSNYGRVLSLPNCRRKTEKFLAPYINKKNGYVYYHLAKNGEAKTIRAHVIVVEAFTDYVSAGKHSEYGIDHLDGDKTNNKLSNLEVVTNKVNLQRAHKKGQINYAGIKCVDLDTLEVFDNFSDAARSVGGKQGEMVRRVCDGERSHYRNHHFARYDDYKNGTIPLFKGKFIKKASEALWQ